MHAQRVFQIDPFSTLPLYICLISAGIILTAVCFFWSPLKKFRPIRIFSVLISLCAVLGAYTYISDIVNVYLPYRRGEYQIVTGEVEHYNKRPDTSQPITEPEDPRRCVPAFLKKAEKNRNRSDFLLKSGL